MGPFPLGHLAVAPWCEECGLLGDDRDACCIMCGAQFGGSEEAGCAPDTAPVAEGREAIALLTQAGPKRRRGRRKLAQSARIRTLALRNLGAHFPGHLPRNDR